jgi:putative ABC transport system permease protein
MIRIAWRSLTAHKLRTILTTLAILLGVAMISGTYVLTDQIDRGFNQIFADAYKGTDVTVTRKASFTGGEMTGATAGLPESMVAQVRGVKGVAEASGYVAAQGAVAVNGKVIATGGAPTLFFGGPQSDMSSTKYVTGAYPTKPGEVGIIQKLAQDQKLTVGSPISVITDAGPQQATVSGVFTFGAQSSLGGSLILNTTLSDAQTWFDLRGRVSEIDARAQVGTTPDQLASNVRAALPGYADVKTGAQAQADASKSVSAAINTFLQPALLSFGGIAVLVGAFIIFNAFSMTVAQRRREFAMLRALGASRRQVMATITGEALAMGVFASLVGLFAGLGVASLVNQAFKAYGADIPRSGLVMEPRTVIVALVVGILVTLLSAIVPAARATSVPPVVALQEGATLPPSRFSRFTPYVAIAVAVVGGLFIAGGMVGVGGTTARLGQLALGAVFIFVAVAMVSRYFVGPVASVLGWPLQKISPTSGRLARDNSMRNPGRTAATAAALMIGLGVVVFVAVFAQGLKSSFVDVFDRTVRADYVIQSKNYIALPADTATRVASVPQLDAVSAVDMQQVQVNGKHVASINAIDTASLPRLWRFDWRGGGSDALLRKLYGDNVLVEQSVADTLGVKTGQTFKVLTVDGQRATFKMIGEYRDPIMLNGILTAQTTYASLFPKPQVYMVLAKAAPGTDPAQTEAALKAALATTPTAEVRTATQYKDSVVGQVNQLLNLLYGLLAMSVIISLFGIVNTLVLAVYERTREIGLIRAIGASRRQVRRTVRYESVITSIIGGLLGIVVGVVFAYVVTTRFGGQGITFSIPGGQLVVFLIIAVIVGVIAAILPARRASRIDILEAIHYE